MHGDDFSLKYLLEASFLPPTLNLPSLLLVLLLMILWKPLELGCSRTGVGRRVPVTELSPSGQTATNVSPVIGLLQGQWKVEASLWSIAWCTLHGGQAVTPALTHLGVLDYHIETVFKSSHIKAVF